MPSNILVDGTKDVSLREYHTAHMPNLDVPPEFVHTRPSAQPTVPSTAGLTGPELAQVNAWLDGLVAPTLANAITYKTNYEAYNAALDAWKFADKQARVTQYRISFGDALIYNKPTTPASASASGTGSTPPGPAVYPRNDP